jgi:tRNA dimethylallyltransferase
LEQGYSPDLPSLSAIGYREMIAYIRGQLTLEEAVMQMKRATRIFVRRQANWFKQSDATITWYDVKPGIYEKIEEKIRDFETGESLSQNPDFL